MNRSPSAPIWTRYRHAVCSIGACCCCWLFAPGCAQEPDPAGPTTKPALQPQSRQSSRGTNPAAPAAAANPLRNKEKETSSQTLAYPTGNEQSSVIVLEKRFPTQARLGQVYKYELKVTNLKDYPISNVTIREAFPASFAVLKDPNTTVGTTRPNDSTAEVVGNQGEPDPPPPAQTRPSATDADAAGTAAVATSATPAAPPRDGSDLRFLQGVGYVRDVAGTWWGSGGRREKQGTIAQEFLVGTLEPHESRSIPVAGISEEMGKLDTRSMVTYTPVLAGGTDVINPILKLSKTGPRHADLCDVIEVKYVVSNVGTGTETDVRIEETLPDGLRTLDGRPTVSIYVGDLPQEQGKEYSVKLKAARTGEFGSKALARGYGTKAESDNVLTAVHAPKLAVAMTGPSSEYVGKAGAYELTITNTGDAVARNTSVTASADAGATVQVSAADSAGSRGGGALPVGAIDPGASRKVRIAARPSIGGPMAVQASVKADCADAVSASAQTTVLTIPALVMEVTDRDDPVRVGESTEYRIVVKNEGSGADHNVKVVASLPSQWSYIQSTGPTPGTADGQRITFETLPSLEPGQTVTWTVEVKAQQAGDARFKAELTSASLKDPVLQTQSTQLY